MITLSAHRNHNTHKKSDQYQDQDHDHCSMRFGPTCTFTLTSSSSSVKIIINNDIIIIINILIITTIIDLPPRVTITILVLAKVVSVRTLNLSHTFTHYITHHTTTHTFINTPYLHLHTVVHTPSHRTHHMHSSATIHDDRTTFPCFLPFIFRSTSRPISSIGITVGTDIAREEHRKLVRMCDTL